MKKKIWYLEFENSETLACGYQSLAPKLEREFDSDRTKNVKSKGIKWG